MTQGSFSHWQSGEVILDHYEVRSKVGEGGMGSVYHVYHRGWKQDLAVKRPKPELFAKEGGKQDFIREAETWVNLALSPHIVSCYYVRLLEEIPCIFSEYVAGGCLSDWIRQQRLYEVGTRGRSRASLTSPSSLPGDCTRPTNKGWSIKMSSLLMS